MSTQRPQREVRHLQLRLKRRKSLLNLPLPQLDLEASQSRKPSNKLMRKKRKRQDFVKRLF